MEATNRNHRGFTLMELLMTLVVLTVLVAATVPAFDGLTDRKHLSGAQRLFFTTLAQAKQAAVTRNRRVSLCPSRDGVSCLPMGHWHRGWLVFVDADADREPDADEPVLERRGPLDSAVRLVSSRYRRVITFQPTGTAGGSNATFTLCPRDNVDQARAVVLSLLGRIRMEDGDPGECPGES